MWHSIAPAAFVLHLHFVSLGHGLKPGEKYALWVGSDVIHFAGPAGNAARHALAHGGAWRKYVSILQDLAELDDIGVSPKDYKLEMLILLAEVDHPLVHHHARDACEAIECLIFVRGGGHDDGVFAKVGI